MRGPVRVVPFLLVMNEISVGDTGSRKTVVPELLNQLRRIRNELAHGEVRIDSETLRQRISELGLDIPPSELGAFISALTEYFGATTGQVYVPAALLDVVAALLIAHPAKIVCDPWAGIGALVATVSQATGAQRALAFTRNSQEAELGRVLTRSADWSVGDVFELLRSLDTALDVAASILPFGGTVNQSMSVTSPSGETVQLSGDLGQSILVATAMRLSAEGIGLFVVTPSFFFSQLSARHQLDRLGLGIDAALALPSGTFAPYTNIPTYLIRVRRQPLERMFVAQLSIDRNTNREVVANLVQAREGGSLDLGRFVEPQAFIGLDAIRTADRFEEVASRFGAPPVRLGDIATAINLGRSGEDFQFPKLDNSIYVPLIGNTEVVDSQGDLRLKAQNYCQVRIDPARSDARFVAQFLNAEFGKEVRESSKSGAYVLKLNKQTITALHVFVPPIQQQRLMLETEARIMAEHNTLLGLQNELAALRRDLWSDPRASKDVSQRVTVLANRMSTGITAHANECLDQWFETLPFPLASILRAWQATPSQDFKTKHEHLLHFFEAIAEFTSAILLSAFASNESLFGPHREKMKEILGKQHLSFRRATFGTWKIVVEYLGKQTRVMLADAGKKTEDAKNARVLCGELFGDSSLALPTTVSRPEVADILSRTNKMRNDWTGHGGVVGQEEARIRNEKLLGEVQTLRQIFADAWIHSQLVQAVHCRPRRGLFENEIAILAGSNSEFLKETRPMSTWLDVEQLYLVHKDTGRALQVLPLVRVGPSPNSVKNTCYFFNRFERDGVRFVSYHFSDTPELTAGLDETASALKGLMDI